MIGLDLPQDTQGRTRAALDDAPPPDLRARGMLR